MKKIAFIGVGVMGKSMVRNLHQAGYTLTIYTRHREKVEDLIQEGIIWKDDIKSCVKDQDVIMSMVGYPQDVQDIYYGQDGILNHATQGSILIDLTTSSPQLAKKINHDAKEKGLESLDAPVSGGDIGAKNATLSIMVGGKQETFEKVKPILQVLGRHIHYVGEAGLGQHTKIANQIVIAGTIAAVSEAIHYAHVHQLDMQQTMNCLLQGAAQSWQLEHNGQAMIDHHFQPGFYIKHFIKDMMIAKEEMGEEDLPVLNTVLQMYSSLNEEELGTQALIHYFEGNS